VLRRRYADGELAVQEVAPAEQRGG